MSYIIKERVFTLTNKFRIDSLDRGPGYEVVGRFFSIGNKLKIYDDRGKEVLYIKEKLLKILPKYEIYKDGRRLATIKKKLTAFKPKFTINSSYGKLYIEGDILHHDFRIVRKGRTVARISKRWVSVSDTYSVEIADDIDHPFILGLVIVLDQIFYDGRKSSSNTENSPQ